MKTFEPGAFVRRVRDAAVAPDARERVRALMVGWFSTPAAVQAAMAGYTGADEVLFEDATVSIWYCRFEPGTHVPPHDHRVVATIGVYEGAEDNHFYRVTGGALARRSTRRVRTGDVISIGPDAIHSVETAHGRMSRGIHVYLGPLTSLERSLFDWTTGEARPYTQAEYERMVRGSRV